jgi:hypothetical protein
MCEQQLSHVLAGPDKLKHALRPLLNNGQNQQHDCQRTRSQSQESRLNEIRVHLGYLYL